MDIFDDAFQAFGGFLSEEVLKEILQEEIYQAVLEGITGITRVEALELAEKQAGMLISDIITGTREGIAEIIKNGLENQIGVDRLAKNLLDQIGLTPQRIASVENYRKELESQGLPQSEIDVLVAKFSQEQLRDRAEVIANTEMRRAMEGAELEVMTSRGARYKVAITVGDDAVSDICQENEAVGPIPVDDSFPSGDDTPPFHPNCRCRCSYITSDEQLERAKERANTRIERTKAAKS